MTPPEYNYPMTIESRVLALVVGTIEDVYRENRELIEENARRDDAEDDRLFDSIREQLNSRFRASRGAINDMFTEMYLHNRGQFNDLFRAEFGADALFNEPWAQDFMQQSTDELLRRLEGTAGAFTDKVRRAHEKARGSTGPTFKRAIGDTVKLRKTALRNAAYNVRDVSGDLMKKITWQRFKEFGIVEYEWINRQDKRVRGNPAGLYPNSRHDHWKRHGQIYSVNHRHTDGHPGEPNNCRCMAMPHWPDYNRKGGKFPAWILALIAGIAAGAKAAEEKEEI